MKWEVPGAQRISLDFSILDSGIAHSPEAKHPDVREG